MRASLRLKAPNASLTGGSPEVSSPAGFRSSSSFLAPGRGREMHRVGFMLDRLALLPLPSGPARTPADPSSRRPGDRRSLSSRPKAARCRRQDFRPVSPGDHRAQCSGRGYAARPDPPPPLPPPATCHGRAAGQAGTAAGHHAYTRHWSQAHRQRCAAPPPHRVPRRSRSRY